MRIIIVGGGASGFFFALNAARIHPGAEIIILEKSSKLLAKVRISGGGRCNVTHDLTAPPELVKKYPRGEKELLSAFNQFSPQDTIEWFRSRGVTLKTEADGRMFPVTDSSETIIDCFYYEAEKLKIKIIMNCPVTEIIPILPGFRISSGQGIYNVDLLMIASGGNTDEALKNILLRLGHTIVKPVPSLFTFNVPKHPINHLMGVSVPNARIKIKGTKFEEEGPLLITHWGFSGPAVLRLSAWGARHLAECNYQFEFSINWLGDLKKEELSNHLLEYKQGNPNRNLQSFDLALPKRLWQYLIHLAGIKEELKWQDMAKILINKLSEVICQDQYEARGKTTYKEEFVSCGGISRKEIDFRTMQSKIIPGLFFAGEVIDIDGITGGFNFQNAWTTAWIAANSISIS